MAKLKRNVIRDNIKGWMKIHDESPDTMATRMHMSRSSWIRRMHSPERLTIEEVERLEFITKLEILNGKEAL